MGRDKDAPEQGGCSNNEFVHLPASASEVMKAKNLSKSGVLPDNFDNMEENQNQMDLELVFNVNEGAGKGSNNDDDAVACPNLMTKDPSDMEYVEENQERASLSFVDKGTKDGNPGTNTCTRDKRDCAGAPKPSLMDWNPTARTVEVMISDLLLC